MIKEDGMCRKIPVILCVMLICCGAALAADKKDDKAKDQPATAAQQEKDSLAANIGHMRAQELRVAVLQQLHNEELAKLRSIQEAFCAKYKLDIEKFRKGLYRYDENKGKFVEIDASQPKR